MKQLRTSQQATRYNAQMVRLPLTMSEKKTLTMSEKKTLAMSEKKTLTMRARRNSESGDWSEKRVVHPERESKDMNKNVSQLRTRQASRNYTFKQLKRGILITVEGIDGCGKTTFIKELSSRLNKEFKLTITKEPGDSALGVYLRQILQEQPVSITSKAEYLLFAADRAQHATEIIEPALKKNFIVISDRMGDSSVVYQGFARGLGTHMINQINIWAMNGIKPDIIFHLKLDPQKAVERIQDRNEKLTAFEKEKKDFMHKVAAGYDTWFADKKHVVTLDAEKDTVSMANEAYAYILSWIETHE